MTALTQALQLPRPELHRITSMWLNMIRNRRHRGAPLLLAHLAQRVLPELVISYLAPSRRMVSGVAHNPFIPDII